MSEREPDRPSSAEGDRDDKHRLIPRIALLGVVLAAFGVSLFLVDLSRRSSDRTRATARADGAVAMTAEGAANPFLICTDCHQNLDKKLGEDKRPDLIYTHEEHFATGVAECTVCHPDPTHVPDETYKPTMDQCFVCHGMAKEAIASGACTTCHPPGMRKKPASHLASQWVPREHAQQAKEDHLECLSCHNTEMFCTSCHGAEMPHPGDWAEEPHVVAFFDAGAEACEGCHPREPEAPDFCDTCHHPEGPEDVAWRAYHPGVVKEQGADRCFQCHDPSTCATCHVRGRETFEADEARVISS